MTILFGGGEGGVSPHSLAIYKSFGVTIWHSVTMSPATALITLMDYYLSGIIATVLNCTKGDRLLWFRSNIFVPLVHFLSKGSCSSYYYITSYCRLYTSGTETDLICLQQLKVFYKTFMQLNYTKKDRLIDNHWFYFSFRIPHRVRNFICARISIVYTHDKCFFSDCTIYYYQFKILTYVICM